MTYLLAAVVGIGIVLLLGMCWGALVSYFYPFEFGTSCQGGSWRRSFPSASKASIREFLQVFVDAFAFPGTKRLTFSPDDSILAIYRQLYPSRWIPDALEIETFAKDLEKLWGVKLEAMWSERLTLGEVFAAIHDAQSGSRGSLTPSPHTTHRAGPQWAVQQVGSHDEVSIHIKPNTIGPCTTGP